MSKLIEFATAMLAKEKGFEVVTSAYSNVLDPGKVIIVGEFNHNFARHGNVTVSRPEQSVLQKWLREKHLIQLSVSPWKDEFTEGDKDLYIIQYEGNVIDVKNNWNTFQIASFCKGYEECLEALLIEGLKLVNIKTIVLDYSKITNIVFGGIIKSDHPDYVDAYVASADYNELEMTEKELDVLNSNSEFVHDKLLDQLN